MEKSAKKQLTRREEFNEILRAMGLQGETLGRKHAQPGVENYGHLQEWLDSVVRVMNPIVAEFFGAQPMTNIRAMYGPSEQFEPKDGSGTAAAFAEPSMLTPTIRVNEEAMAELGGPMRAIVHELTHLYALSNEENEPYSELKWLHEGLADYVAALLIPQERTHQPNPRLSPSSGYTGTAAFLEWLESHSPGSVRSLAKHIATGTYWRGPGGTYKQLTGDSLKALFFEYEAEQSDSSARRSRRSARFIREIAGLPTESDHYLRGRGASSQPRRSHSVTERPRTQQPEVGNRPSRL
jgi:hypothetical protein